MNLFSDDKIYGNIFIFILFLICIIQLIKPKAFNKIQMLFGEIDRSNKRLRIEAGLGLFLGLVFFFIYNLL